MNAKQQLALETCLKSLHDLCYVLYVGDYTMASVRPHIDAMVELYAGLTGNRRAKQEFEGYCPPGSDRGDRAAWSVVRPWAELHGIELDKVASPPLPEGLKPSWGDDPVIDMSDNTQEQILHALAKLKEIAEKFDEGTGTNRDLFQFGYNAGRLAELTNVGRIVWDRLKDKVESGAWGDVLLIVGEWKPEAEAGLPIEPQ